MTRRDYLLISDALADRRESLKVYCQSSTLHGFDVACRAIAIELKRANSAFDQYTFLTNCGVK